MTMPVWKHVLAGEYAVTALVSAVQHLSGHMTLVVIQYRPKAQDDNAYLVS